MSQSADEIEAVRANYYQNVIWRAEKSVSTALFVLEGVELYWQLTRLAPAMDRWVAVRERAFDQGKKRPFLGPELPGGLPR